QRNLQVGNSVWQHSQNCGFSGHVPLVARMISLLVNCGQLSAALDLERQSDLSASSDFYPVVALTRAHLELGNFDKMFDVLMESKKLVTASHMAFLICHAVRLGHLPEGERLLAVNSELGFATHRE